MAFLPALPDPAASPLPGLLAARGGIAATESGGAAADFVALLAGLRGDVGKAGAGPGTALPGKAPGVPSASEVPRAVRSILLETAAGLAGELVQAAAPDAPAKPAETPPRTPATLAAAAPEVSQAESAEADGAASPDDSSAPSDAATAQAAVPPGGTPSTAPALPPAPATAAPDDSGVPADTAGEVTAAADAAAGGSRAAERDPAGLAGSVATAAANAGTPAAAPPAATPADSDAEPDASESPERAEKSVTLAAVSEAEDVALRTVPRPQAASANPTAAADRPPATARGPELPPQAADAAREAVAAATPASESATRSLPAAVDGGETVQPTTATATTPARADAALATPPVPRGEAPPPAPPAQASNAGEVSLVLARAAADGQRQITIRMHPAELGKVEVRLDFGSDGALKAAIRADTPEALDLLQRDVRLLERALSDAGFRQGQTSLDFSLGQDARQQQAQGQGAAGTGRPDGQDGGGEAELDAAALAELAGRRTAAGGIDIVI